MKKGAKENCLYRLILAYGANGAPPKIAPNENLVFDIKVTDVVNQETYQEELENSNNKCNSRQRMMEQMQKQMQQQQQKQHAPPSGK